MPWVFVSEFSVRKLTGGMEEIKIKTNFSQKLVVNCVNNKTSIRTVKVVSRTNGSILMYMPMVFFFSSFDKLYFIKAMNR